MDNSRLGNYFLFLSVIQKKIDNNFADQKEYIFCKEGCAKCCCNAQFPYSEIEFRFLLQGFYSLGKNIQFQIINKIESIIQAQKEHVAKTPNEKFRYDCPFLINNSCSVYKFRGLICRCFGLMAIDPENKNRPQIPFCAYEGLNYSNVLDVETNTVSVEKYKEQGLTTEPKAFNTGYLSLTDNEFAKGFDFEFGDIKPMIDWLVFFGITRKND